MNLSLSLASLALGYTRDFQQSFLSDFYGLDRIYTKFVYFFSGKLLITLEGGLGFVQYPNIFFNPANVPGGGGAVALQHDSFTDKRVDGTLFSEYRFTSAFALNATLRYTANFSENSLPVSPTATGPADTAFDMSWRRFEGFLGVRLFL